MTVLSGGGERSGTDGRSGVSLIEKMVGRQSAWVLTRIARCAVVVEGARRVWEEKDYAGLTGCGFAESGRGGEVRSRKPGVWRLVGGWSAAGFGRR